MLVLTDCTRPHPIHPCPMSARGRSPDVSPIAYVGATFEPCKAATDISINIIMPPHDLPAVASRATHLPTARLQPWNRYLAAEQPIASSSRLEPPPQLRYAPVSWAVLSLCSPSHKIFTALHILLLSPLHSDRRLPPRHLRCTGMTYILPNTTMSLRSTTMTLHLPRLAPCRIKCKWLTLWTTCI